MSKTTKPVAGPKPLTEEEKQIQVARFLANEKKTFFQIILGNILHQQGMGPKEAVDLALSGADYAITKLYPVEKTGE